jgi:hypothetical protein
MKQLLPVMFLFITAFIQAQSLKEFHVIEREPDEVQAVQASVQYPDNAILFVYSAMNNLSFRSSVGGINQQRYNDRANRYEILITPQRQIIFVSATGFIEQRLALVNPSPKQPFYYEVEERRGQDEARVIFIVEPKDAKLYIDEIPIEINNSVSAPVGQVNLRLEREGYRSIEKVITIDPQQVNYNFKLDEIDLRPYTITSNVEGARIKLGDDEIGSTDASKSFGDFLFPGVYTFTLSKALFKTTVQTIEISESSPNTFRIDLEKNVGTLSLNVTPRDAVVEINGDRRQGRSFELLPRMYTVTVKREGYEPVSRTVDIKLGETMQLDISLEPHVGSIQFSVTPATANAKLIGRDGKVVETWRGVNILNDIPVGSYTIEVSASGYQTQNRRVEVSKDERTRVEVSLQAGSQQTTTRNAVKPTSKPSIGRSSRTFHRIAANEGFYFAASIDFPLGFNRTTLRTYDRHHFIYNPNSEFFRFESDRYGFQDASKNSMVVPFGLSLRIDYNLNASGIFKNFSVSVEPFFSSLQNTFYDRIDPLDYPKLQGEVLSMQVNDVDTILRYVFENALRFQRWGARFGIRPIPQVELLFPLQHVGFQFQHRVPCINCQENNVEAGKFTLGYGVRLGHTFSNGIGLYYYWEGWNANFSEFINEGAPVYVDPDRFDYTSARSRIVGFEFQIPVYSNHLTLKYENPKISGGMDGAFTNDLNIDPSNINSISMHYWQMRYTINF